MTMNKIIFDLNNYDLDIESFEVLLKKNININQFKVNDYYIEWNYTISNNILELEAILKKL